MPESCTSEFFTDEAVAIYGEQGFFLPLRMFAAEGVAELRAHLEAAEARQGSLTGKNRSAKYHLLMTWLDQLVRHAGILDAVEKLLGPDILCWGTALLIKEPGDGTHVSWHQDLNYWGLDPADVTTAWLALSPATKETGCMRMMAGSHLVHYAHRDTDDPSNLLSRGQTVADDLDEAAATYIELQPGEISLHHGNMAHASGPNSGSERRIGIAIRYLAAHVRPTDGPDSALLVRGQDRYRNFEAETSPAEDFDPAAMAEHDRVMALRQAVLMAGI